MRSSIQLSEAGYNLPYQSSSTSYYSVCMILISSNVVNERQNKFYSGLYQHHIRYKRKRIRMRLPSTWQAYTLFPKFPNTLCPSWRLRSRELVVHSYTKLFSSFVKSTEKGRYSLTNKYVYIYRRTKWNLSFKPISSEV